MSFCDEPSSKFVTIVASFLLDRLCKIAHESHAKCVRRILYSARFYKSYAQSVAVPVHPEQPLIQKAPDEGR